MTVFIGPSAFDEPNCCCPPHPCNTQLHHSAAPYILIDRRAQELLDQADALVPLADARGRATLAAAARTAAEAASRAAEAARGSGGSGRGGAGRAWMGMGSDSASGRSSVWLSGGWNVGRGGAAGAGIAAVR
jgi:hypothetical protein